MLFVVACALVGSPVTVEDGHDAKRAAEVAKINAIPGVLWRAGLNSRFAGLPLGASQQLAGVKSGAKEHLRQSVAAGKVRVGTKPPGVTLPDAFDSASNWPHCAAVINDIRDQSACGCCWAFGAAEAASDRLCIATNATVSLALSAQDVCFCTQPDGCNGGFPEMAWEQIGNVGAVSGAQGQGKGPFASAGLCSAFTLPHCHHHGPTRDDPYPAEGTTGCPNVEQSPECPKACDAGAKAPHDDFNKDKYTFGGIVETYDTEDGIAHAIMTLGPVEAAFNVMSDFENYVSGIYHTTSTQQLGGHAIKIVGWGEEGGVKYWKVANSWNPYWGENGYFRIRKGTNECGIEDQVVANGAGAWKGPGVPAGPPTPPAPPKHGPCDMADTKAECVATTGPKGQCKWCFLSGIGVGICQNPDESC